MTNESANATERRAILLVFTLAGLFVVVALFAFWLPMRRRMGIVQAQLLDLRQDISSYREQEAHMPVSEKILRTQQAHDWLRVKLDHVVDLHDTFRHGNPLQSLSPTHEEGRIDFKVALFNARTSLLARAQQKNVVIPPSLGMEETIGTDVLAETRLWQLASTVRLLEQLLAAGIPVVDQIQSLDPRTLAIEDNATIRFYPLRVELAAEFPKLLRLLETLIHSDAFFSLRRFRIERPTPDSPQLRLLLRCDAARRLSVFPSQSPPSSEFDPTHTPPVPGRVRGRGVMSDRLPPQEAPQP